MLFSSKLHLPSLFEGYPHAHIGCLRVFSQTPDPASTAASHVIIRMRINSDSLIQQSTNRQRYSRGRGRASDWNTNEQPVKIDAQMQLGRGVELIQQERQPYKDGKPATPIFLIHDGGGTTFAYHCMDSINRHIYGISNPYFHSPETFEGSLADLAELYTTWIRTAVTKQDFPIRKANDGRVQIYLGGWSLGGMLSLEVAKRLVDDDGIKVVGILMVDTIYPGNLKWNTATNSPGGVLETGLTKNEILSRRCMVQARRMVGGWKMPVWDADDADTRPKSVLLRAKERLPTAANPLGFNELDTYREDKKFGWGAYDRNMFAQVFPVDGHHFDLFSFGRVEETTKVVKRALERLDKELASKEWPLWC